MWLKAGFKLTKFEDLMGVTNGEGTAYHSVHPFHLLDQ